jgi:hypothetical protein
VPPSESSAPTPAAPPTTANPPVAETPAAGEKPAATEKPAPAPAKKGDADASAGAPYFVQVGAFKSADSAKRLATRLRELKYNVDESSMPGAKSSRGAAAAGSGAGRAASDKYDVYVTGGAPADINAKLAPRGLTSESSAGGVVVRPSLPLRDAVALSKDLAVDGLKVQVRRATSGAAPAPSSAGAATSGGDAFYRVRVGPFDDRATATATLHELEQRGYKPFIARSGS